MRYFSMLTFMGEDYFLPGYVGEIELSHFLPFLEFIGRYDKSRVIHYWVTPAALITDGENRDITEDELSKIEPVIYELIYNDYISLGVRKRFDRQGILDEPFEDHYNLQGEEREEFINRRNCLEKDEKEFLQSKLDEGCSENEALDALFDFYYDLYSDDPDYESDGDSDYEEDDYDDELSDKAMEVLNSLNISLKEDPVNRIVARNDDHGYVDRSKEVMDSDNMTANEIRDTENNGYYFSIINFDHTSKIISGRFDADHLESCPELLAFVAHTPYTDSVKVEVLVGRYDGQTLNGELTKQELELIEKMRPQMIQQGFVKMLAMETVDIKGHSYPADISDAVESPKFCSNCGNQLENGMMFCSSCGARISELSVQTDPASELTGSDTNISEQGLKFSDVPARAPSVPQVDVQVEVNNQSTINKLTKEKAQNIQSESSTSSNMEISGDKLINAQGSTGDVIIPDGIVCIADNAFANCKGITSVKFPSSLESIGKEAFLNCTGLKVLDIPDCVTTIGDDAFLGCVGVVVANWPKLIRKKPWLLEFVVDSNYLGRDRQKCCRFCGKPIKSSSKRCSRCKMLYSETRTQGG